MNIRDQAEKKMQQAIEHLKDDLKSIRTGRANPAILDSVSAEVYGSQMRLKDLASISAPEPRQLLISPFDSNNSSVIAKAIEKANLNLQVICDGNVVRINVPPMTENLRKDMVKLCGEKKEKGKVSIRNARKTYNDELKKLKSSGDISEDEQKKTEKKIQELTDKYCKESDQIAADKEKEILTI